MRDTRWKALVVLGMALALVASACRGDEPTQPGTGEEEDGSRLIVAFIPTRTNTYINEWARGAEETADELGYELTLIENDFDQAEQDTQVQQQLGAGDDVAAYIWWPSDNAAGVASLQALSESGIPVIQTNQLMHEGTEDLVVGYAGVDDKLNGRVAAEMVVEARDVLEDSGQELHSPGGNAVIVGFIAGYQAGIDRTGAATPILEDDGINILGEVEVGFDPTTGYDGMKQLIAAHRDDGIDLVYAHNSALGEGVIQALEEEGYSPGEDVMVVGGTCHGNLEHLEEGKEYATGLQAAFLEGVFSIRTLDEYLTNGELAEFHNFIPNPPVRSDEIDEVTLEGYSVHDLCVY